MFSRRPKLSTYFRSKFDEYAVVIDEKPVLNACISDQTVLFHFGAYSVEVYKKDAEKIVDFMIADLQSVLQHLKEK